VPTNQKAKKVKKKIKPDAHSKNPAPKTAGFFLYLCNLFYKMMAFNSPDVLEEEITDVVAKEEAIKALLLYNDDVNTFDFVTESLIKVCKHDAIQAEQCTYLVHYTGKCVVKNGTFKALKPLCEALLERGLSAKIED
jgi:ATP-dependent Clp protease adaptor protein ClpS